MKKTLTKQILDMHKKPNITPGKWEPEFISNMCTGVRILSEDRGYGRYFVRVIDTILPETDKEYLNQRERIESEVDLICKAGNLTNSGFNIEALPELVEALKEISKCEGVYSLDRLQHAENTIKNVRELAEQALKKAKFEE